MKVELYEKLDKVATESSDPWNNAGTGHSGFCELNYYPQDEKGDVLIEKAIKIAENFEVSKQFWSSLVDEQILPDPKKFIQSVPHISFVWGDDNVAYLYKRFHAMQKSPLFKDVEFSDNFEEIEKWIPLVMKGRDKKQKVAATKINLGTDVNFGEITSNLFDFLKEREQFTCNLRHDVTDLKKNEEGKWQVEVTDLLSNTCKKVTCKFVFIGAGGGSLLLLEKSRIPEGKGIGGFPISGQWLRCINPDVINQHQAKVYGKAGVDTPPMSVPHIDSRVINGKRELLFGPYAGFSTKFLKEGSYMDLLKSITFYNIIPTISVGIRNLPLVNYLFGQVVQSIKTRIHSLTDYYPLAKEEDWALVTAGQRVQVILRKERGRGLLQFGTEIVYSKDGSLAVMLGASPGASSSVTVMLDLIQKCFPDKFENEDVQQAIKKMIPTFRKSLHENEKLCQEIRQKTSSVLKLNPS